MAPRIARATINLVRASASARLAATPHAVFGVIADLTTWPRWLDVVTRVEDQGDRAWRVRLGVKLGPVDLGRDVRLVATTFDAPVRLVVEREELDGRDDHSPIEIAVDVTAAADAGDGAPASDVTLAAHVGKRLPLLDLEGEIERRGPAALRALKGLVRGSTGRED
jgi:carbon monoxide dehydrogenase subunit G